MVAFLLWVFIVVCIAVMIFCMIVLIGSSQLDSRSRDIISRLFEPWKSDLPIEEWREMREVVTKRADEFIDRPRTMINFYWAIGMRQKAKSLFPHSELYMDILDEK